MHKKTLILGGLTGIICVLLIVCAGCTSIKDSTIPSGTQAPVDTPRYTPVATPVAPAVTKPPLVSEVYKVETLLPRDSIDRNGTLVVDVAFEKLFQESVNDVINKTNIVILEMSLGETELQIGYSPVRLYLAAQDLGFTADDYYNKFLTTPAIKPETQAKKIAYLQYLYMLKNAGYHIAAAANYELQADYPTALAFAQAAKIDLQPVKANPNLPPTTTANRLFVYLNEYIGKLSAAVKLEKTI